MLETAKEHIEGNIDIQNDVFEDTSYLEAFFENLLLGKSNDLKNRYLHLNYTYADNSQTAILNRQNVGLQCDLIELASKGAF